MQRTLGLLALAVALLFVSTPAAAQTSDDHESIFQGQAVRLSIEVAPNAVFAELHDITIDGDIAAGARQGIDRLDGVGDGDGVVSEEEVVTFETAMSVQIDQLLPSEFQHDLIKLDGQLPQAPEGAAAIHLVKIDIKGADGTSIDSTEPIRTDIRVKILFDSVDDSRSTHSVELQNVYGDFTGYSGAEAPPVEVLISGWNGWSIIGSTIEPEEVQDRLADDTLRFTNEDFAYFDGEGERLYFEIQGDPDEKVGSLEEGAPAPGVALALSALGLALVLLRRR